MQVTDSAVNNIRPSLADFLSQSDLPTSVCAKSTVLFERRAARSSRGARQNEKTSRIFFVMDSTPRQNFYRKPISAFPSTVRSFDLPAMPRATRVLFEIALSRIMHYFSSYRTSKKRHVRGTEKAIRGTIIVMDRTIDKMCAVNFNNLRVRGIDRPSR